MLYAAIVLAIGSLTICVINAIWLCLIDVDVRKNTEDIYELMLALKDDDELPPKA